MIRRSRGHTFGLFAAVVGISAAWSAPSFAWGSRGHRVVNLSAIELMTSPGADFFQTNKDTIATLANTPDGLWKKPATHDAERPMHFFQWDVYRDAPVATDFETLSLKGIIQKVGNDFVSTNGSAVWRSTDLFKKLVTALKAKDWKATLQMAGVLGHYVGDLSQPMHATADYDGQSIHRAGVHMYFETTLVQTEQEANLVHAAVTAGGPMRQGLDQPTSQTVVSLTKEIRTLAFNEGKESYAQLAPVLSHFQAHGQDDAELKDIIGPRMGNAAATLAKIWDRAVEESGTTVTDFPAHALSGVDEPTWFDLDRSSDD